MIDFGKRLKQLRTEKNLTQKELASMIGVKNSVISFYEVGDRTPSPEVIKKLATVLNVSSDYLLGIAKKEVLDISGLDENDKKLVRILVDTLRYKNSKLK